jgi:hypothetical protein
MNDDDEHLIAHVEVRRLLTLAEKFSRWNDSLRLESDIDENFVRAYSNDRALYALATVKAAEAVVAVAQQRFHINVTLRMRLCCLGLRILLVGCSVAPVVGIHVSPSDTPREWELVDLEESSIRHRPRR